MEWIAVALTFAGILFETISDSRNYGFDKLTPLIKSIGEFELEQRENPKSRHKLIFVRNKKVHKPKSRK